MSQKITQNHLWGTWGQEGGGGGGCQGELGGRGAWEGVRKQEEKSGKKDLGRRERGTARSRGRGTKKGYEGGPAG